MARPEHSEDRRWTAIASAVVAGAEARVGAAMLAMSQFLPVT